MFQKFIKCCHDDAQNYSQNLVKRMSQYLATLRYQQSLLEEKLNVCQTQINFVSTMRKTKARSNFMMRQQLKLKVYYFTPNDHVELVEGDQKSQWSKNYQEYVDNEKKQK